MAPAGTVSPTLIGFVARLGHELKGALPTLGADEGAAHLAGPDCTASPRVIRAAIGDLHVNAEVRVRVFATAAVAAIATTLRQLGPIWLRCREISSKSIRKTEF